MKKSRALLLLAALVVLGGGAVLVHRNLHHIHDFFGWGGQHGGHSELYWVRALDSSDAEIRHNAIRNLGAIGPTAEEAVPRLAEILAGDPDAEARVQASLALTKMAPASRAAVPALAEALGDEDLLVRMNSALALSVLREEARPAVPALLKALEDESNQVRVWIFTITIQEAVVQALGRASAGSGEAVPSLLAIMEAAETLGMRMSAARALGEIGPEAREAVPQLEALLKHEDEETRLTAEEALRKIRKELAAQ